MMLDNVDMIPAYERQHLLVFKQDIDNSPHLNETQKRILERKLQEVVDVWTKEEYK